MSLNYSTSVVVVSGLPGSCTSTIAKEIVKRLNIEYFSPDKIFKKFLLANNSRLRLKRGKRKREIAMSCAECPTSYRLKGRKKEML